MKTIEELESLNPCPEALEWAKQQPSLYVAWEVCERSDWMFWLLYKLKLTPKELSVTYSRQCAEHVSHLNDCAVTYAADAAYDAYVATNAIYAAYAAAVAAAAAAAAYVANADAERKWQSNLLRTLVSNPFEDVSGVS